MIGMSGIVGTHGVAMMKVSGVIREMLMRFARVSMGAKGVRKEEERVKEASKVTATAAVSLGIRLDFARSPQRARVKVASRVIVGSVDSQVTRLDSVPQKEKARGTKVKG